MLPQRMLIVTLLLCFAYSFCSEHAFKKVPLDVQNNYIAQYLPFKDIESDEDLIRIVKGNNNAISKNKWGSRIHTSNFRFDIHSESVILLRKNDQPLFFPFEPLLTMKKIKSENSSFYEYFLEYLFGKNEKSLIIKRSILSANSQHFCINAHDNIKDSHGFYIADIKNNTIKYISLPKDLGFDAYASKAAISSDGTLIACAASANLYLFDISTCKDNQELTSQEIKTFNIREKIKNLEFNQQCTKLAIAYKVDPQVEIIPLEGRTEPNKTLADYFRKNLISPDLNGTKSKN
jgi:hypothetical protein